MKKIVKNIIGVFLIAFGVIGGFIPILQGWVFVLTGFIILDFKKKQEYEKKIIDFISKTKFGEKLASLWKNVKKENRDVIENDKDKGVKAIYQDIKKNKNG